MTYWRMQMHPSESEGAIRHTVESLSAGYIGLDFASDVPDLLTVGPEALPDNSAITWLSRARWKSAIAFWCSHITFPLRSFMSLAHTTTFAPLLQRLVFGSGISGRSITCVTTDTSIPMSTVGTALL
jgi:hypothetical protein